MPDLFSSLVSDCCAFAATAAQTRPHQEGREGVIRPGGAAVAQRQRKPDGGPGDMVAHARATGRTFVIADAAEFDPTPVEPKARGCVHADLAEPHDGLHDVAHDPALADLRHQSVEVRVSGAPQPHVRQQQPLLHDDVPHRTGHRGAVRGAGLAPPGGDDAAAEHEIRRRRPVAMEKDGRRWQAIEGDRGEGWMGKTRRCRASGGGGGLAVVGGRRAKGRQGTVGWNRGACEAAKLTEIRWAHGPRMEFRFGPFNV